ncbi:division/cell wall cluster transcriptional repressor MraZ [Agaribacterium haliotis]|uniref:division/cell wall cluster transcriptional repressor MraZ n=1 Tax=Agaribacterium haliotis TaxID=2013869 RepID=UPI000BB590C3|nr:division/cell wall cluster transcriptional repressor MraZ [Agaribacterium haliotis]
MFQGSNTINMDAKGRIAIPTKCRDELLSACGGQIVVTAHMAERCLCIYPLDEWKQNILPQVQALPTAYKQAARVQRLVIGYAHEFTVDANGRILLPPTLREFASLQKKLMLVGLGNKYELWDEAAWMATLEDAGDEPIPEAMLNLSI